MAIVSVGMFPAWCMDSVSGRDGCVGTINEILYFFYLIFHIKGHFW